MHSNLCHRRFLVERRQTLLLFLLLPNLYHFQPLTEPVAISARVWYTDMLRIRRYCIRRQTRVSLTNEERDTFLVTTKLKKYTETTKEMRIDTEVAKFFRILSAYATQRATTIPPIAWKLIAVQTTPLYP